MLRLRNDKSDFGTPQFEMFSGAIAALIDLHEQHRAHGSVARNQVAPNRTTQDLATARAAVQALSAQEALELWRATMLTGANGRARAMQEKRARKMLDRMLGKAHFLYLPVDRYHEMAEDVAWPPAT